MANFWKGVGNFFTGTPERFDTRSNLDPQQMQLQNQATQAGMSRGAGGAFGDSADYYRNLLSDESADYDAFAAPEMRNFQQNILPSLSAQFGGLGAGDSGLTGSSFRNAAMNAGTDLSERLGAIRAQLRQQGAQGLQQIGQSGLNPHQQTFFRPQQPGLLQTAASGVGQGLGAFGGGVAGYAGANWANKMFNPNTNASPTQGGTT